jgi:lipopolysaccharide biosynthesis protein
MKHPYPVIRSRLASGSQWAWQNLPIPFRVKLRFKNMVFHALPGLFAWTRAYRRWQAFNFHAHHHFHDKGADALDQTLPAIADETAAIPHVPKLQAPPLKQKPAKLICFYLPQFHPIPENDAWWGQGFTEWTNVRSARPRFKGHEQPHVPGELGYYDLRDPSVLPRQIELARLYGIEGFCFYFYWFGGQRLLEGPLERFKKDRDLNFPFCLCWANENWSRRWDGRENEILMAQEHSPEDDLAFIAHVARYLEDSRYIRIKGRPLLLVYRPDLLPSARKTAKRWRCWCRDNGIGDIYLACTQSFEAVDPAQYDFDAAVEFPPNNSTPPDITDQMDPLDTPFAGTVFDWRTFIERSRRYRRPPYTFFRGVCPAWDNTPRRKQHGIVFQHSSPQGYQQWLCNAIQDTCKRFRHADERLIFINAWNEWAEGAYLEPDQRRGYAYLEATRMALVRRSAEAQTCEPERKQSIAIVIHAFYAEIFEEIFAYLKNIDSIPCHLYVTATSEHIGTIGDRLAQQPHPFRLLHVENRGRDILPFLTILPEVLKDGHEFLVKIHTKKSSHRQDGDQWRQDIFAQMLSEKALRENFKHLKRHPEIGILGPDGHMVPMQYYWGSNAAYGLALSARLGLEPADLNALHFAAGSMFMARIEALHPLFNLALPQDAFESENGQIDGTLAHALERMFSVSARSIQLRTQSKHNITTDKYNFANRTMG